MAIRDRAPAPAPDGSAWDTGIDTLTGAGLAETLTGADVVVDVSFTTSTTNLEAAAKAAGVGHYVADGARARQPDSLSS